MVGCPSHTLIYNTTKVKPGEVPRSFEDLLNPRRKGRLVMDREEYDWLAGMIDLMGENKATAFLKKLVDEQGVKLKKGSCPHNSARGYRRARPDHETQGR